MATKLIAAKTLSPRSQLAATLVKKFPGAELSWKFGNASLVVDDKVFAFPSKNSAGLVIKLPEADVQALLESGNVRQLTMGKRTMREWVVAEDPLAPDTLKLVRAAFNYVASLPKSPPKSKTKKP
ncbi:MAG: hypothetical protein ABI147_06285 [Acidobacteriaceae bacterium]